MIELLKELKERPEMLILGFGKEGRSTYQYVRQNFRKPKIGIADMDPSVEMLFRADYPGDPVTFHLGENYLNALQDYPLIVKSPGVALPADLDPDIRRRVTSQTDLIMETFHRQVIGVTGTKGKSTTSSLIHHLLKEAGRKTILVGNIGIPPFDHLHRVGRDTLIVFELSSHQLEDSIHAPHIAVLLNLYPEHLDRYPSLSAYYEAKMKILSGQLDGDTFIYNGDIPEIAHRISLMGEPRNYLAFTSGIATQKGCYLSGDRIFYIENERRELLVEITGEHLLRGKHNRMNMMAAILSARTAGLTDQEIRRGLVTFKGLEHRLEYVGEFGGIHFYNDSIATIPEAAMAAVRSLPETDTLIIGGLDRGLDYGPLADFLAASAVRNIIFMGQAGRRICELIRLKQKAGQKLILVNSLEEAFREIPGITAPGKICLMSPAASSYDSFRNFEERGNLFKNLARSL